MSSGHHGRGAVDETAVHKLHSARHWSSEHCEWCPPWKMQQISFGNCSQILSLIHSLRNFIQAFKGGSEAATWSVFMPSRSSVLQFQH